MSDLDACRVVDHMFYRACADRDNAAFGVVTQAVKGDVFDFLLGAQVLANDFYGDLVGIFGPRNMVEDVVPIFLFKVKVLHIEDLSADRDPAYLERSIA